MILLNKPRGTGKSLQLVYTSEATGCPIVVFNTSMKDRLLQIADEYDCKIPEPIVAKSSDDLRGRKFKKGVLIDNVEFFIGPALEQYFDCPVIAATQSYDNNLRALQLEGSESNV